MLFLTSNGDDTPQHIASRSHIRFVSKDENVRLCSRSREEIMLSAMKLVHIPTATSLKAEDALVFRCRLSESFSSLLKYPAVLD